VKWNRNVKASENVENFVEAYIEKEVSELMKEY
jgi:hypothetical protein